MLLFSESGFRDRRTCGKESGRAGLDSRLPGIALRFTGGFLDRPIEFGGSLLDAVCHLNPPSLSYKEQFFCSP